jgi:hypothetical protein
MNNFKILTIGIYLAILSNHAAAQYRDFTSKNGKIINALPIEKNNNSIKIKTKDGKEFTLDVSVLSDEDTSFISSWKAPEYGFKFLADRDIEGKTISERDCIIQISEISKAKDPFSVGLAFKIENQREVMKVLGVFVEIIRDKENFLKKKSAMGESYRVKLLQFKNNFTNSDTEWVLNVESKQISLIGKTNNKGHIECEIEENGAVYLLEYLNKFDGASTVREFIKQSQSIGR